MASSRGRRPRRRTLRPVLDRFVDGISRLTPNAIIDPPPGTAIRPGFDIPPIFTPRPTDRVPDVVVDVTRPTDLVALRIEAFGMALQTGESPRLLAGDDGGYLVVQLAFQHLTERAIYEGLTQDDIDRLPDARDDLLPGPEGVNARHKAPELARAANASRVVFEVPASYSITFSSEGILEAIASLPMAVHPLAAAKPTRRRFPELGPSITLGNDLVAVVTAEGLVVGNPRGARRPARDVGTLGLNQLMRDRRMARAISARLGATAVRGTTMAVGETERTNVRVGGRPFEVTGITRPGGILGPELTIPGGRRPNFSREPRQFETAIEAPYRLIVSPSAHGGWTHATTPVGANEAAHRVELWHSRLGVRQASTEGETTVNERSTFQRILRAVWARDRDVFTDWATNDPPHSNNLSPDNIQFRMSLDSADRHILVRQSAETWIGATDQRITPDPFDVRKLYLSSMGAWLNVIGNWDEEKIQEYALLGKSSIESWEHIAPMGRDQFVKVVYPGYLFPFGIRCSLVKLTERKMKDASPSVAGLFQRKFLIIKEPLVRFSGRDMPITELNIQPVVTPTLSPEPTGDEQDACFVPHVAGAPFQFVLHMRDQEDRPVRTTTPLVWVAAAFNEADDIRDHWKDHARVAMDGQKVAFAPVRKGGDTLAKTAVITFDGAPIVGDSTPTMVSADVTIDAVEQLSGVGPVRVAFHKRYLDHAFDPDATKNPGEVWAELVRDAAADDPFGVVPDVPKVMSFGAGSPSGSDKAGGFIAPNVAVAGLSRIKGTVNDLDQIAQAKFDPAAFLGSALPKLFGIVDLIDLLDLAGISLDDAPDVVSETLDRIEAFTEDLERAKRLAQDAVDEANRLVIRSDPPTKPEELKTAAAQALTAATTLKTDIDGAAQAILDLLPTLVDAAQADIEAALTAPLATLRAVVPNIRTAAPLLPPAIRSQLLKLADVLETILDAVDLIEDIVRFLSGLGSSSTQFTYRYEWVPLMKTLFVNGTPLLKLEPDSLMLAVEGRMDGKGAMGIEVLAELRDFALHLMPGEELVRFQFDHLSFKSGTSGKAEVDVVLGDIEFVGLLGFVETLKDLIPFDGFSDPPYLDVTAEGLTAGFSIDLPNVAVGVFNMSNLSLGADVRVPFLGESVSVGFNFCTRERPFTLAVLFIGGGGFFGLRLGPDRLQLLEVSLEAGAVLAVDFGVASGSISAMVGVYIRLEGDAGSLSGYFRLRGEVDVLGLISASIELYLELNYDFPTGKMVGSAQLTIKVEVLFFSASVTVRAERRLAGSNGDPNFIDIMGLEADGSSPAWSVYCLAFAEV